MKVTFKFENFWIWTKDFQLGHEIRILFLDLNSFLVLSNRNVLHESFTRWNVFTLFCVCRYLSPTVEPRLSIWITLCVEIQTNLKLCPNLWESKNLKLQDPPIFLPRFKECKQEMMDGRTNDEHTEDKTHKKHSVRAWMWDAQTHASEYRPGIVLVREGGTYTRLWQSHLV